MGRLGFQVTGPCITEQYYLEHLSLAAISCDIFMILLCLQFIFFFISSYVAKDLHSQHQSPVCLGWWWLCMAVMCLSASFPVVSLSINLLRKSVLVRVLLQ